MSHKHTSTSGGIGFLGMLTILFIGLKLTGYIDWSWGYVLLPIYIIPLVLIAIGIVLLPAWYLYKQIKRN